MYSLSTSGSENKRGLQEQRTDWGRGYRCRRNASSAYGVYDDVYVKDERGRKVSGTSCEFSAGFAATWMRIASFQVYHHPDPMLISSSSSLSDSRLDIRISIPCDDIGCRYDHLRQARAIHKQSSFLGKTSKLEEASCPRSSLPIYYHCSQEDSLRLTG